MPKLTDLGHQRGSQGELSALRRSRYQTLRTAFMPCRLIGKTVDFDSINLVSSPSEASPFLFGNSLLPVIAPASQEPIRYLLYALQ